MSKTISILLIASLSFGLITANPTWAQRKSRPWPEISLSTLPSVVGMSNSWPYEIQRRSPVYLADLDKLHVAFSYGKGRHDNDLNPLAGAASARYGYSFYQGVDYSSDNFKLDVYSHLGKTTFGSVWAVYGEDEDRETRRAFLTSEPNRVEVRTAFAWTFKPGWTAAVAGTFSNYPYAYVFALQPSGSQPTDSQFALPANVGEQFTGTVDVLHRSQSNLDLIVGAEFLRHYTKFAAPDPPAGSNYRDTSEVKEYIYSGAPRVILKKTFSTGDYVRAGASVYFNLVDYQYTGAGRWEYPSLAVPSYRTQTLESMVPKWNFYLDGSHLLSSNAVLYGAAEVAGYPNRLTRKDTDFVPVDFSLLDVENITTAAFTVDIAAKLTPIFHGTAGVTLRYLDTGPITATRPVDDRSLYPSLHVGTQTRFYRSLWWTVRVNEFRLYTSEEVGTAALMENRYYFETEVLFLGL